MRTRVNQLLQLGVPSLFAGNLFLDGRDLFVVVISMTEPGKSWRQERGGGAYQVSRLNLEAELLLLEILSASHGVSDVNLI